MCGVPVIVFFLQEYYLDWISLFTLELCICEAYYVIY
jgi:hypothetical protein